MSQVVGDETSDMMIQKNSYTMYKLRGPLCAFLSVVIVTGFIVLATGYNGTLGYLDVSSFLHGYHGTAYNSSRKQYAVVFDAGSTGSRIHVYHFESRTQGSPLELISEFFQEMKPGLSYYAHTPKEGAESLLPMLNRALALVPSHLQKDTPLALRATAGLRLLPDGAADNLLNEVTDLFKKYPFLLPPGAVEVMDGTSEGIFSWITVNFLLGTLQKKTVAALDLGGGSTQVTFIPKSKKTFREAPEEFLKTFSVFYSKFNLYTHSYLGLGLMSARFAILGGLENKGWKSLVKKNLSSSCLPLGYTGTWKYGGLEHLISGPVKERPSFEKCLKETRKTLLRPVRSVEELKDREVFAVSYYFERAVDVGLIDPVNGGEISVKDFKEAAEKFYMKPKQDQPLLAMDLGYIYSLLHEGFGLSSSTRLVLKKKIKNTEVSWGLGAAFHLLASVGLDR